MNSKKEITKLRMKFLKSSVVFGAVLLMALITVPYLSYFSVDAVDYVLETEAELPNGETNDFTLGRSFTAANAQQQEKEVYDVVFSGGGAKGIALIGAVREMEEQGLSYNRLVGTSAGTIMAVLLAAGYDADELEAAMAERSDDGTIIMSSFLEIPESFDDEVVRDSLTYLLLEDLTPGFLPGTITSNINEFVTRSLLRIPLYREVFSFIEFGGVFSGDLAAEWIAEKLDAGGRNLSGTTLAEFHERTGSDFTAVATDTTLGEMMILNHRSAPDLPTVEAVRMSTAVPFVYQERRWQPEWGTYLGEDVSGDYIVDGGLSSNLAIELVLSLEPEIMIAMGVEPNKNKVIGLFLDQNLSVEDLAGEPTPVVEENDSKSARLSGHWQEILGRSNHILDTMLRSHDHFIAITHPSNVCHIPVKGYGTMNFNLGDEEVQAMMDAGQVAMRGCLAER